MINRIAILAVSAIAFTMPLALLGGDAHAEGTNVERQCQNGVCGQAEYVNGKVQITVSSELSRTTHFNFRTNPGAQIEIGGSFSFDRAPGASGTYSVQACDKGGFGSRSTCTKWATFDWTSGPKPIRTAGKTRIPSPEAQAEFESDQRVTGKSPEECIASRGRCYNRCLGVDAIGQACRANSCDPLFASCISNATRNRDDGPAATLIAVVKAVDVYAEKFGEGGKTGALPRGTKVSLLEPCADDWCHVQFRTGSGWVYNGDDYKSLDLP